MMRSILLSKTSGLLVVFLMFGSFAAVKAQDLTITGTITDNRGETLVGTSIFIQEFPQIGTTADIDGNYTLTIPAARLDGSRATLVARFVSYRTQQRQITLDPGEITQNFQLVEDLLQLDEIVVTGQGTSVELRKLATPLEVISARQIENSVAGSVEQLLQGQVPGANIRMQSAQPGQAGLINLRGINSAFASQTPVIYIDGVRVDNSMNTSPSRGGESTSAISDLLISDIERIEITKGGAASTLFGSDASNGVIQIFTKRGTTGAPRLTLRSEQGFDAPVTKYLKDTGFAFPSVNPDGEDADPDNVDFGRTRFIRDNLLQTGYYQSYYAALSGGTPGMRYNFSGRVQDAEGVQVNNNNRFYSLRGSFIVDIDDNFFLDFSGGFTYNEFERLFNGTAIADPLTAFEVGDALFFTGTNNFDDALEMFLDGQVSERVNRFTLAGTAGYNPVPAFTNRFTVGIDYRTNYQRFNTTPFGDPLYGVVDAVIERDDREYTSLTLEYRGSYRHSFNPDVQSTTTFGVQGFRENRLNLFARGETFALPGIDDFDSAADIIAAEDRATVFNGGFFLQQQVDLWDKLFLNAGVRLDGNSAFGDDIGLIAYPRVGVAYEISGEDFWRRTFGSNWSQMKLRTSYGLTGQFPEEFRKDLTFSSISFRSESAPRFDNPGNDELKAEQTATFELGFDAGFLSDRLGLNFTWYRSVTNDALFFVPEPPATGRGSQLRNVGTIENVGLEFSVRAQIISQPNYRWSVSANYSTFSNEVTDMGGSSDFTAGTTGQRVSEGQPVGAWEVTTPIDTNGDGLLDGTEPRFTGTTPYPTSYGGLSTEVTLWNRLTFFANADFALDYDVFDYGSWWSWFNGLDRKVFPTRFNTDGEEVGNYNPNNSQFTLLEPGDYFKIREVSVRYELPRSFRQNFNLVNAHVFFSMRNVYTWSKSDLLDPEMSGVNADGNNLQLGGAQSITLPSPRQYRLGISVTL